MTPRQTLLELEPDCLPAGTEVGAWRVLALSGKGAYGAVYRVEPVGAEGSGSFALKLALHPEDPRFEREVELLSRIRHPSVPTLKGRGLWAHPAGPFPFLVMEWVEGLLLYDWAREHKPRWRQLMRVLAQAQALERAAETAGPGADLPLPQRPAQAAVVHTRSATPQRSWRARGTKWAVAVGAVTSLSLLGWWSIGGPWLDQPQGAVAQQGGDGGGEEAGTTGLAEDALTVSASEKELERTGEVLGAEVPEKPLPGQKRTPCKREVAINGGCWLRPEDPRPPCSEGYYEWKGACYFPILKPPPPATSQPRSQ